MPKKTTILIIILAVITGFLVFLAVTADRPTQPTTTQVAPPPSAPERTVSLYFSPSFVDLSSGTQSASIDLMANTTKDAVTGIQIELSYDPEQITNVAIAPSQETDSLFGENPAILLNNQDSTLGRVSFAIAVQPNEESVRGDGKIATLTFSKNSFSTEDQTLIFFLDKSLATKADESQSILKETSPVIILLQ